VGAPGSQPPNDAASVAVATTALRGAGWRFASELTGKGMVFVSTVVLARLLDAQDFGVAAYALTLIAMFGAVPALGLGPALIYHAEDERCTSTGFWLGLVGSLAALALVWVLAPGAEWIFGDPRAVGVTRGMALLFPIEALSNVHQTLMRRRLAFRRSMAPELTRSLVKGVLSIGLAFAGFGAWALIGGSLGGALAAVPVYWGVLRWRPALLFDRAAAAELLRFGGHVVAVNSLGAAVRNLDYLIVGRVLGAIALGVYTLAFRLPDLLIRNLVAVLGQVLLPVYSRLREERAAVAPAFLTTTAYVVALTAPLAIGLAALAEPIVLTVFSEKWRDVVPVVLPICLYALFVSISYNIGDLYKALGRPDVLTRLGLLRLAIAAPALYGAATLVGSAAAVGWAQAVVAATTTVIELAVARTLFQLPVAAALGRLVPVAAACGAMALALALASAPLAAAPPALAVAVGIPLGALVYLASLRLLAPEFVAAAIDALRGALDRRRPAWRPVETS
jgi:lipopolysaccharide exporter